MQYVRMESFGILTILFNLEATYMTQSDIRNPSFNLWTEPWITVERPNGEPDILNIPQTLTEAPRIHALFEPSPLAVVAIHRLLVAILQDSLRPQTPVDLIDIWRQGQFSTDLLETFAAKYAHHFDLFSVDAPFLQSADLTLQPVKGDKAKPVGYLLLEQPAGTAVTHYTHTYDNRQQFCSHCAAKGLLAIPPFASSGGAGIKPSINGVPPIYILPGGETLFNSLAASLTRPGFEPPVFEDDQRGHDTPWWEHPPTVAKKGTAKNVGYLYGLTFPARRVRLHPTPGHSPCTRCGQTTLWNVATMVYEMGESRPKEAVWWQDPFAAYRKAKKEKEQPIPIRPVEGRAVWREFSGLFLPTSESYRPNILNQLEEVDDVLPYDVDEPIPLRVISLRTDMKMKTFEWQESGFSVPPRLLTDPDSAKFIEDGIDFARQCGTIIRSTFRQYFGGDGKTKRLESVTAQMSQRYWQQLGHAFHTHVQQYTTPANAERLFEDWLQQVLQQAVSDFEDTANTLPDDGATLRRRIEAINHCRAKLYSYRNKKYPLEETQ